MSYDNPELVRAAIDIMKKVADHEIRVLGSREQGVQDRFSAPSVGYVMRDLRHHLLNAQTDLQAGLQEKDVTSAVGKLEEKVDGFEIDPGDPMKVIWVKAVKAAIHTLDPDQYPESDEYIKALNQERIKSC